jgi:predicted RNA polymerase sigma factor
MAASVERVLRELAPQALGATVRRYRDFAACEDAVQEALIAAATRWPREGMPDKPLGWLLRVAARRMTDHIRSESARRRREDAVGGDVSGLAPAVDEARDLDPDDTLVLLFMCCHPALSQASAIALTLRAVGGLTTAEIARAFLVPEATMGQRISRAKATVADSGVPFEMPDATERAARLAAVQRVLYLVFNEGYAASTGPDVHRTDLSSEAIRLTRLLHALVPSDPETTGLLALMLLTDARRTARTGPQGKLIPLDEQDRSLWHAEAIAEGVALVSAALSSGAVGEYQLLAAIAALHDEAARVEDTDWPQILALYALLKHMSPSPLVALNHAVATALVHGPQAGLALLEPLEADERLARGHRLHAVRAHLLERAGERTAAIALYLQAAEKTASVPERDYLLSRAARLQQP